MYVTCRQYRSLVSAHLRVCSRRRHTCSRTPSLGASCASTACRLLNVRRAGGWGWAFGILRSRESSFRLDGKSLFGRPGHKTPKRVRTHYIRFHLMCIRMYTYTVSISCMCVCVSVYNACVLVVKIRYGVVRRKLMACSCFVCYRSKRMSKVKTLQLAIEYINQLQDVLTLQNNPTQHNHVST